MDGPVPKTLCLLVCALLAATVYVPSGMSEAQVEEANRSLVAANVLLERAGHEPDPLIQRSQLVPPDFTFRWLPEVIGSGLAICWPVLLLEHGLLLLLGGGVLAWIVRRERRRSAELT